MPATKTADQTRPARITAKEILVVGAIIDSDYHDGRDPVGSEVWSEGVADDAGLNAASAGGVFASLSKKGFVDLSGRGRDATVTLTREGLAAAIRQGIAD